MDGASIPYWRLFDFGFRGLRSIHQIGAVLKDWENRL